MSSILGVYRISTISSRIGMTPLRRQHPLLSIFFRSQAHCFLPLANLLLKSPIFFSTSATSLLRPAMVSLSTIILLELSLIISKSLLVSCCPLAMALFIAATAFSRFIYSKWTCICLYFYLMLPSREAMLAASQTWFFRDLFFSFKNYLSKQLTRSLETFPTLLSVCDWNASHRVRSSMSRSSSRRAGVGSATGCSSRLSLSRDRSSLLKTSWLLLRAVPTCRALGF